MENKFSILEQLDGEGLSVGQSSTSTEGDRNGWHQTIKNIPHPIQVMVNTLKHTFEVNLRKL